MSSNPPTSTTENSSHHTDTTQGISGLTMSVAHPRLLKTDPSSIRTFLKAYDQYCHTVIGRAKQLQAGTNAANQTITTEVSIPIELKYCVDATHFASCLSLIHI